MSFCAGTRVLLRALRGLRRRLAVVGDRPLQNLEATERPAFAGPEIAETLELARHLEELLRGVLADLGVIDLDVALEAPVRVLRANEADRDAVGRVAAATLVDHERRVLLDAGAVAVELQVLLLDAHDRRDHRGLRGRELLLAVLDLAAGTDETREQVRRRDGEIAVGIEKALRRRFVLGRPVGLDLLPLATAEHVEGLLGHGVHEQRGDAADFDVDPQHRDKPP